MGQNWDTVPSDEIVEEKSTSKASNVSDNVPGLTRRGDNMTKQSIETDPLVLEPGGLTDKKTPTLRVRASLKNRTHFVGQN